MFYLECTFRNLPQDRDSFVAFIGSSKFIPSESIAVVAGLITLVVTSLSTILKGIVENGTGHDEVKDNK